MEGKTLYFYHGSSCSHGTQSVTVREHIGDVASDEAEQAGRLWSETIYEIYPLIQPDKMPAEMWAQMFALLFGGLYLAYNMDKPFVPQLQANSEKLKLMFVDFMTAQGGVSLE
jgi:hypothetical protein